MNLNEFKILNEMFKSKRPLFFRELSKKTGVSIGGVQQVLKNYSSFIEKETKGRNTYYFFKNNLNVFYLFRIIENKKVQFFIEKNSEFKELFNYFIKNKIDCLIFGSYAKGISGKKSDLDLLVFSAKKFPEYLCPVKLHVIRLSKLQFESAFKKKEALIKEILKNHIIINGVDYFSSIMKDE